jgi:ubiquinone/menaquinone biosynthesis C-methylase UbiE
MLNPLGVEPEAFRAFEHAGWQTVAAAYDQAFNRLTTQTISPLLEAAAVARGTSLLDVATGPGYVAAEAAKRGARVVAIDFSAIMIERARRAIAGVEFREADATALPFRDESFDAVTMNYGLLHLARPELAIEEAQRVLRPGGRFAFSVWASPELARGLGIVLDAIRSYGDLDVPQPPGPPFFRFSDALECERVLEASGFVEPRVSSLAQLWPLPSADALFEALLNGTVRTAGLLRAQTPGTFAMIRTAVVAASARYRDGDGIALPMPAVIASALKR